MVAVAPLPLADPSPTLTSVPAEVTDRRICLNGVTWKDYCVVREVLDGPGVRMTYLDGSLEIMSPSRPHELWKTNIARLVELYAYTKRIPLQGYGSTTFRKEAKERGTEPDECYVVGKPMGEYPDIVLEVIHSSPLLDKLKVYASFPVAEVWTFKEGRFTLYELNGATGEYETRPSSARLPGVDFEKVAAYAVREDAAEALWEFGAELANDKR